MVTRQIGGWKHCHQNGCISVFVGAALVHFLGLSLAGYSSRKVEDCEKMIVTWATGEDSVVR